MSVAHIRSESGTWITAVHVNKNLPSGVASFRIRCLVQWEL